MDFPDAFPNLKVSSELNSLLQSVIVERITMNQAKNSLHVYISSRNWISKQYVYELEDAIASQIFDNVRMEVKIVEKFQLSAQYTPANFYKVYRPSMLLELKTQSNLIHQMFLHAGVEFPDPGTVLVSLPDDDLYQSREEELLHFLDKVFCDRAGFSVSVECDHIHDGVPHRLLQDSFPAGLLCGLLLHPLDDVQLRADVPGTGKTGTSH